MPLTSGPGHRENIYLLGHAVCDVITKTLGVREELVITEMFRSQTKITSMVQMVHYLALTGALEVVISVCSSVDWALNLNLYLQPYACFQAVFKCSRALQKHSMSIAFSLQSVRFD